MLAGIGIMHPQRARCPVCGEEVDLSDDKAAMAHMTKDDAHKQRVAKIQTDELLDMAVGAGILRRV